MNTTTTTATTTATATIAPEEIQRQLDICAQMRDHFVAQNLTPTACVDTFGCQQNVADGEKLMGMLQDMGFTLTSDTKTANVVILNTCAIRDHAEQRVFGNLGALKHNLKQNPNQIICLCGCMAQQERVSQRIKETYRHVSLVFGPHALWKFPELLSNVYKSKKRVFSVAPEDGTIAEGLPIVREGTIRAWVSIMYGCNNYCSYCIVPYVRGRERSRDKNDVLREVADLVAAGFKEITLLGQNVNSYGNDLDSNYDFADLLSDIDKIPGKYYIRFMSSHPKDATYKLFDVMAQSEHIAHQLHLPFQSGNNRVLEAMNRRYTKEKYLDLIHYAKAKMPGLVVTSDVIIGFPGETADEVEDTITLVRDEGFDALFTFIYSPRPGTKAATFPDPVSREEKQVWFDKLLAVQNASSALRHQAYVGQTIEVLIDGESDDEAFPLTGRTEGNRLVRLQGDKALIGSFAMVEVTGCNTFALNGVATPS